MNANIIGYIALAFLVLGYVAIIFNDMTFYIINSIASSLFILYSYLKRDYVFLIANSFILIVLLTKLL